MTEQSAFEKSKAKQTSSSGRWFGRSVIYGKEEDAQTAYMTRYWIGRLRLHIFYRGDHDPDHHDHPWDFWTFPLTSYVEEVVQQEWVDVGVIGRVKRLQIVRAWRITRRPAEHCHRVIGRYSGEVVDDFGYAHRVSAKQANDLPDDRFTFLTDRRKIITIVWRGGERRKWGFLKHRDGRWCWQFWKDYVFKGGKGAPCE